MHRRSASTTRRCRSAARDPIRVGPAPVLASRISYAGELGWELYVGARLGRRGLGPRWSPPVAAIGLEPFGYRALEALRLEKGYRYYGTDLTMRETPDEAGLGAFVRPAKGPFIGRDAIVAATRGTRRTDPSGASGR